MYVYIIYCTHRDILYPVSLEDKCMYLYSIHVSLHCCISDMQIDQYHLFEILIGKSFWSSAKLDSRSQWNLSLQVETIFPPQIDTILIYKNKMQRMWELSSPAGWSGSRKAKLKWNLQCPAKTKCAYPHPKKSDSKYVPKRKTLFLCRKTGTRLLIKVLLL